MIDFRSYTTVPKNFELEKALAENYKVQTNNEIIIFIGITTVVVLGLSLYIANEQYNDKIKKLNIS